MGGEWCYGSDPYHFFLTIKFSEKSLLPNSLLHWASHGACIPWTHALAVLLTATTHNQFISAQPLQWERRTFLPAEKHKILHTHTLSKAISLLFPAMSEKFLPSSDGDRGIYFIKMKTKFFVMLTYKFVFLTFTLLGMGFVSKQGL